MRGLPQPHDLLDLRRGERVVRGGPDISFLVVLAVALCGCLPTRSGRPRRVVYRSPKETQWARRNRTTRDSRRFIIVASALFIVAACDGLKRSGKTKPAGVLVSAVDTSDSTDISKRCGEATAPIQTLLDDRRLRRLDVLILGTGDNATGGEPRVVVPWTTYLPARKLYGTRADAERERLAWLADVANMCRAAIRPSKASPVYEMVERSLASIVAHCTELDHAGFGCVRRMLSVSSDLRSTHGAFGRYLRALSKRPKKPPPAPQPFDVTGVETRVCGLSNTDAGDGISAEIVLQAWQTVLGRSIAIDPVCAVERDSSSEAQR